MNVEIILYEERESNLTAEYCGKVRGWNKIFIL